MADEPAGSGSLSSTFSKVNHWRMVLMDISMIGVAIGAVVATGGAVGFFDPVIAWAKMHVSGIEPLVTKGASFLASAFKQAGAGVWATGATPSAAALHAGHGMASAAAVAPVAKTAALSIPSLSLPVFDPVSQHGMHAAMGH